MREEAASETAKANKDDGGEDDKDDNKKTRSKSKQSSHKTKGRQKSSSLKKVNLPDDNLNKFFSSSQDKNSQETADITPANLPKKSKGTESKDEPKILGHGNIHRSPQGSRGEGSPEPPSKLKPESKDSSSSSSSSSDSQFSDEEKDNCRGRTRTFVPSKKKHRS